MLKIANKIQLTVILRMSKDKISGNPLNQRHPRSML
jgi:hypothetical protein